MSALITKPGTGLGHALGEARTRMHKRNEFIAAPTALEGQV